MITREITYFDNAGPQNTDDTIRLAVKRAKELGIKHVVVASVSGETGVKTARAFKGTGAKVVVVGHHVGFSKPGVRELEEPCMKELQELGAVIVEQTHAPVGRGAVDKPAPRGSISRRGDRRSAEDRGQRGHQGRRRVQRHGSRRRTGAGRREDRDHRHRGDLSGSRYACVILPAHANNFFDLHVLEIVSHAP